MLEACPWIKMSLSKLNSYRIAQFLLVKGLKKYQKFRARLREKKILLFFQRDMYLCTEHRSNELKTPKSMSLSTSLCLKVLL